MKVRRPVTCALVPTKPVRPVVHRMATAVVLTVALAGCGVVETADKGLGKPSPRVVAANAEVPKGGGKVVVGKPYTIAGKRYVPKLESDYEKVGFASWYGGKFHGRRTANGEIFDANHLSAAHPTMPLPSYARITSMDTGRSVTVRVNDRGPFHSNRVVDISRRTADLLGVRAAGIAKVKVEYIGPAPVEGDDKEFLLASYTEPGGLGLPATMLASAEALPGVAARAAGSVAGTVADAASGLIGGSSPAAPVEVASVEVEPVGPRVTGTALPPSRPVFVEETYVVVASIDPADVYLAAGPVLASAPASVQPVGYTPASFVVGPQPVSGGNGFPALRSSYAAERINQAYAALDRLAESVPESGPDAADAGLSLTDLIRRLEAKTADAPKAAGPVLQAGIFADADNAARLAAALDGIGLVTVDDIAAGERTLKRVRVSALAVTADEAVAAAERAGAEGARIIR